MKGLSDPGEQWMIILGKSVNMTNRPAKYKMVWWRKIGTVIAKFLVTKIWVPIRRRILRRK